MTILVTGATGFIGRALCTAIGETGRAVRAAVRGDSRLPAAVDSVPVGDIGAATDWDRALTGTGVVVHLAGLVHMMRNVHADPLEAYRRINVAGTLNLARQAADRGVRRLVFLSSIKVNGEHTEPGHPFAPDDRPAPEDSYAVSKWEAEQGLRALAAETGLEIVIIRPPLVYGPGVGANFLAMIRWLQKGIPLPLGAVDNRRSLVGLDNLVDLIVTCIAHSAAADQTFLVSDGEDLSTPELLRRVAAALGRPARLLPVPPALLAAGAGLIGKRAVAQRLLASLQVDIGKTRELLGWAPPVTVDEGLRKTAAYFLLHQLAR